MNWREIEGIANAVLYEGYMLYPYRASAVKNRQRWNFGVLYPETHCKAQNGIDPFSMQTQCLIRGGESAGIEIKVRFLQAVTRQIGKAPRPRVGSIEVKAPELEIVDSLEVGDKVLQSWQEVIEREVIVPPIRLADVLANPQSQEFSFTPAQEFELVKDESDAVVAVIVRTREAIHGCVAISACKRAEELFELTVVTSNFTPASGAPILDRDRLLLKCLLSAHTVLGLAGGQFISLLDPPAELHDFASACANVGTWPVLVGDESARDALLSSPIILYDYPRIAPESPGDLFDGTEIDEILALRILTLSDEEKRELRRTDARTRAVLERTESMPVEHFLKLHGALRGMKPVETTSGTASGEGER